MNPAAGKLSSPSPARLITAAAPTAADGDGAADAESDADGSTAAAPDLSGMTKAQLLAMASELGIEGVSSRNTKAEIVAAIEAAER